MQIPFKPATGKNISIGVGSALVDILLTENDEYLSSVKAAKGGMTLVNETFIPEALKKTTNKPAIVPGGSACNTILGIGKLGGAARFIGKRGTDSWGTLFEDGLKAHNVEPRLFLSPTPTGRVLSIITPDAQRSMMTYLGASSETKINELTEDLFASAALVHLEGYLLFNLDLMMAALKVAKASGALISLDMASYTVVEASKHALPGIIRDYVDILIANEDEAKAYTGFADESKALEALAKDVEIAVLKVGKRGSFISANGKTVSIGIKGDGRAVDTTGAGDLWAAGFLYGLLNGYSLEKCGELGSACGYEVCQVIGAAIPEAGWQRIRALL